MEWLTAFIAVVAVGHGLNDGPRALSLNLSSTTTVDGAVLIMVEAVFDVGGKDFGVKEAEWWTPKRAFP